MADPLPGADAVYFNGEIMPASQARVPVGDHGLLYGLGFFETFRTVGGRPHSWSRHWARLSAACARVGIELPASFLALDETRLAPVLQALLARYGIADAVFRYTVSAGPAAADGRYRQPSEFLTLRPLPPAPPPEGIALRVLRLARDNGEWIPRPKSLNFANAILGGAELQRRAARPDDEGLFLTRDGLVVEAVRHNLAWIKAGRLFYPHPELGAVAGTRLGWLCERFPQAQPARIDLDGLVAADAVIVLNAVRGITPVAMMWSADDRTVLVHWASADHSLVRELRRHSDESFRPSFQPA